MAYFDTKTSALLTLGYSLVSIRNHAVIYPAILSDEDTLRYVQNLLDKLDLLDSEIEIAIGDSMASKVADIEVNYSRYLNQARYRGSGMLSELSTFLSISIHYDRYSRESGGDNSIAIKNYY